MPEGVGRGIANYASLERVLLHDVPDGNAGEAELLPWRHRRSCTLQSPDEQGSEVIHPRIEVRFERLHCPIGEENDPDLPPLSADGNLARIEIEVSAVEGPKLREAQPSGEEGLEDRKVALSLPRRGIRRTEQTLQFLVEEHLHLALILLEARYAIRRIDVLFLLLDEIPEEGAEDRQMVILRPDGEFPALPGAIGVQCGLIDAYGLLIHLGRVIDVHEGGKQRQRLPIGINRQRRLVFLSSQVL